MPGYFDNFEHRSIVYSVESPAIRQEVVERILDGGYNFKDEYHITVVPRECGEDLTDSQFERLAAYFRSQHNPRYTYSNSLYAVTKPKIVESVMHPRESLVAPVGSVAILAAVEGTRFALGIDLPQPFPHVTIATRPDTPIAARGIGIETLEQWTALRPEVYAENWRERRNPTP